MRALACFTLIVLSGCTTYSVRQSSFIPLPTAPAPAPMSGRGALDLGASVATDVRAPSDGASTSGLALPRAQPEGALSLRVADGIVLRAYGGAALPQGGTQVTGTRAAPEESAWFGGIGPVFRILTVERLIFFDLEVSGGFAVIPSSLSITEHDPFCSEDPEVSCTRSWNERWLEVMPVFTVGADFGVRPTEWIQLRIGGTVRNQPTNEAAFSTGGSYGSSVSPGPIGLVLRAGVQLDVIDEVGIRADVQWPVVSFGLDYGPLITFGVQGRLGPPGRNAPIGFEP